jgi:radical SAM protein with 4Fe4S-binding SPASM domain
LGYAKVGINIRVLTTHYFLYFLFGTKIDFIVYLQFLRRNKFSSEFFHGGSSMNNLTMHRPIAPFYVQFEVTWACNHNCFFCYNDPTQSKRSLLTTSEIKDYLRQMREVGVFSINFNGGEPLTRPDFFELAEFAFELGFDLHLNTNGTLVDNQKATQIARFFPSACVSVLASTPKRHNHFVGKKMAFEQMQSGVSNLLSHGVKVEVNVCTFQSNYHELYDIAKVMAEENVHVFCVTRYILTNKEEQDEVLGYKQTLDVLDSLEQIRKDFNTYKEVKLPGPVPYCELASNQKERLRQWNTPCQMGYGLCRITPNGDVTPCPLSPLVIGNLRNSSFKNLWNHSMWKQYESFHHLPEACHSCEDLAYCRGGCVEYDNDMVNANLIPNTIKWQAKR